MDSYLIVTAKLDNCLVYEVGMDTSNALPMNERETDILFDAFDKIFNSTMFKFKIDIFGVDGQPLPKLASLRSQLAAMTAERDRLREAMESIAKMSADQSTDKVRMLAIRDGINVRAIGALFPEAAPESEDK